MNERIDRADWQRGEGMVIFSQLTDELVAHVDTMPDDMIADALRTTAFESSHRTYAKAYAVCGKVYDYAQPFYPETTFVQDMGNPDEPAAVRRFEMTHAATPRSAYEEIVSTVSSLPINLIEVAQRKGRLIHPDKTVYQNLGSIAQIMSSDWFGTVADRAAFAKNGAWGSLSFRSLSKDETGDSRRLSVGYEYDDSGDALTFDFDAATKNKLLGDLKASNENFRKPKPIITAGEINGTSSGCPVRNHHAVVSPELATDLAVRYGKPAEELTGERPTNGIQDSLACLGRLLERAAIIDAKIN